MTTRKKPDATVRIGGKSVTYVEAAFMAVEADQRQISPLQVKKVVLPDVLPKEVRLAGHLVDLLTAAAIAELAAQRNATPEWAICKILEKHATGRDKPRRSKAKGAKRE